jgi:tol-pal system protein YbgF
MRVTVRHRKTCGTPFLIAAVLGLGWSALGCTSGKQALEKQVADLERQVVQLRAEKSNLSARMVGLDDELLLYAKRADRCNQERQERALSVVRLRPTDVVSAAEEPVAIPFEQIPPGDSKRPVLKIVGSSPFAYSPSARDSRDAVLPTGLGDNLGVVATEEAAAGETVGGPAEDFQQAYRAYSNGALDEALVRFAKFLRDHPSDQLADNAMFWRGESYMAKGKLLKAVGELERLIRRYPSSEKRPSALYRIGFAYDRLGDLGRAKEYYFKVVDLHPGTDAARRASRRMATLKETGGQGAGLMPASAKR